VILLLLHMLSVVVMGSYKRPRELQWVSGCTLFAVTLGLCFTGYLLPWSQLSFWATTVGLNVAGSLPVIGPVLQGYLQGGDVVGPATLGRAFAFHAALLPMLLVALIAGHLYLVRHSGVSAPPSLHPHAPGRKRRFFPDFVLEDLAVALALLALFSAGLFFAPHAYLPAEAFTAADPFTTPGHVKPEWYFLASYAALRLIPSTPVAMLVQGLALAGLVLLPFLDRTPHRHILRRPLFLTGLVVVAAALVGLTLHGARA
jgi:ubiquinol-cytochrome c reductase cytochrome b subunit